MDESRDRKILVRLALVVALLLPITGVLVYMGFTQPQIDVSVFAPGNNCCNRSDYKNCSTNQDWIDGYNACTNKQCSACAGTSGTCNNNRLCQAGENSTNCPNDCDAGGFSEQASGASCNVNNTDAGRDDCDAGESLKCFNCPGTSVKAGKGFCSTQASVNSGSFISSLCGGLAAVTPPPPAAGNPPPPATGGGGSQPPTVLPDTGLADGLLGLVIGVLLLLVGINLYGYRRGQIDSE